jgi:hypothetical protein
MASPVNSIHGAERRIRPARRTRDARHAPFARCSTTSRRLPWSLHPRGVEQYRDALAPAQVNELRKLIPE